MARPLKIAWRHPAEVFYQLYKQAVEAWIAKRWQALWVLRRGKEALFADEMRLGLLGQMRRVWGRRGEKLRRRVKLRYEWVYLVLGVDPIKARLWWDWVKRVRPYIRQALNALPSWVRKWYKIPVRLFLLAALFRFAWRSRGGGTGRG